MQKNLPGSRLSRWLAVVFMALLTTVSAQAQLAGTKTIPGTYPSLAAAITDLNTQGVGAGGVTFSIAAGYAETFASPTAGAITATGTAANPIVFQKAGTGANPVITAGVGTLTTVDAIISLAGSDYVTIDGLSLTESAANTTALAQMEFGIALFRASATDGSQYNIIRNCVVTLNKTNAATIGINGATSASTSNTAVTATAATGANSFNKVYGNVVTNAMTGIYFAAGSSTATANYDQNNEIGVTAGNTIGNFGGSATAYGAGGNYQNGLKVTGNTINSTLDYTSATTSTPVAASTVTSTLRGIYAPNGVSSNIDITNNTVTLASGATTSQVSGIENVTGSTAANNTVNITGNTVQITYATATTATIYGIYNTASAATININNNTVQNCTAAAATTAVFTGIVSSAGSVLNINGNSVLNNVIAGTGTMSLISSSIVSATTPVTINNNILTGNSKTPTGTTTGVSLLGITLGTALTTITGNTITNNTIVTSGTSTTVGTLVGINSTASSTTTETLSANTVTGLSISGTSTATTHSLRGIVTASNGTGDVQTLTQNTVGGLAIASGGGTVTGIYIPTGGGTGSTVSRNKVYDLSAAGATGVAIGINVVAGGTYLVSNNLIGGLAAPAATGLNAAVGLNVAAGTAVNAYYNTIYLNASSSGATFGSSGLYLGSTSTTLDARNNIVVNTSTAAGTGGYTAALRRISGTANTAPANYATTSNNNLFYAGTPSATNLLYVEGTTTATNAQQTLATYKSFMGSRDQQAVTENPPFASTTGTAANFLHILTGVATQVESGGQPVSGVTTDFDGDTRNATTPDIGADEGSFTPSDLTPPSIVYTALGNTASTTSRTLVATITDPNGIATGAGAPRIYYKLSTASTYFSALATSVSGSTYTFTIDYANIGGAPTIGTIIQYYVAAQDASANSNAGTSPVGGSGTNPPGSTAPATPNSYQVLPTIVGTYYVTANVGSSPTPAKEFATLTAAANAYNNSGLGGAVTFVLRDATYSTAETFPITFNNNPTASATNTLTIQPGVTSTISGTNTTALLVLNGASYVTVNGSLTSTGTTRDLTLSNAGAGGAVVQLVSVGAGATNNTLRSLNILASALTSGIGIAAGGTTAGGSGADNDNLTIQNNSIQQAYVGIYVGGTAATSAGGTDGLSITGNVIGAATSGTGNIGNAGLFVANAVAPTITGNTVQNVGLGSAAAVALTIGVTFPTGVSNATFTGNTINGVTVSSGNYDALGLNLGTNFSGVVDRNRVLNVVSSTSTYSGRGIDINTNSTAGNVRVSNNFVAGINGAGWSALTSDAIAGIRVLGTTGGVGLYYNSVNLSGNYALPNSTAYISAALFVASGATTIDIRNNILVNSLVNGTSTSKAYAFYNAAAATAFTPINYNDYFVSGAQGVLAYFGSADVATLAALRTATTQDANSISADPLFTSPTDLHASAVVLDAAATPIAGVTTDIDSDVRNTTTPDIGADEFVPLSNDLAAAGLVAPATTSVCYSTAEPVSVSIRNAGAATLNFATNAATITVVVTLPGGGTQTFTTTLTTGTLASTATQAVTLPGTLNMSAVGTYSFAITATVAGDGNTANDLLTPAPTRTVVAPVVGALTPAATTICGSGTATLTLAGAANGTIQYQSSPNGTTFTDIAGATSATYTTPVLTATTYFRAQVRCNTGTATSNVSTITVNNPLVASTNTPVSVCSGSPATLTATASAGSSVRFFSAATGGTALTTTTAGTYTTPALTANTTYYVEAFTPATSVAGLADNSAANGTFSQSSSLDYPLGFAVSQAGTLASVDVYPTAAGTLTIRLYSVSGTQPAGTATAVAGSDVTITVAATQVGTRVTIPLNYALTAGDYKLSNAVGGLGRYGTYTGTYPLISADGTLTVKGSYTFFSSTSYSNTTYNSFFNLTFASECVGATRTAIQVNVTQPATTSFPAATASTCGSTPYQLTGTVGGSATTGTYTTSGTGTFSPNATTLNATYTPSAADITAGSVTITLTSTAAPCAPATATLALSIGRPAVATFSYPAATTYCAGSTGTVTPTLATGATAGTFTSTTGLSINATTGVITLSTSTAGTYTVTNTVAASGACAAATATTTVTVTPATSAAFSYAAASFCQTGTNPTPTVTGTAGGTFSSTAGLSLNASTGLITLSTSTLGTYTVTYTVAGACGSSATASVTITSGQSATFSYPTGTTYCAGSTSTVTPTLATGATAGTFTSTTGLTINATTGVVNLATSTAGTYTVTNTVAANGGCAAATATTTITVTPAASAAFSYAATSFCQTGTNPTPTVTGTAGGTFSSTAGLTINATTGAITLSTSTIGTYTVTYTVAGACGASATASVTITSGQSATFSYPTATTYCAGSTGTVTPTLATGATAGTFSSTTGLTINATTGVITLSTSTAGTYTVTNTVAASGGCAAATATTTVTVTPATSAAFSYAAASFCQTGTNPTPTVTGTAGGTFSSTAGLSLNASTGLITLSTSTAGTYTVTYTVAGACGSSATASVTITSGQVATFSYPATGSNCAGSTGTVSPTLATGATAGTFSSTTGLTLNATTGVVNLATSTAGTYTVTNTVAASGGCAAATATATITVNPTPARPTLTPTYNGTQTTLTSSSATGNQYYYNGVLITGATGQTYVVNGSASTYGSYTVVVTNSFGCSSQASVATVVTTTRQGIAGASIQLYPNPTPTGQVTLELTGFRSVTQLVVLDALGRVVSAETLPAAAGTVTHALDLSRLATGVYMLRLTNADGVETRRLTRE